MEREEEFNEMADIAVCLDEILESRCLDSFSCYVQDACRQLQHYLKDTTNTNTRALYTCTEHLCTELDLYSVNSCGSDELNIASLVLCYWLKVGSRDSALMLAKCIIHAICKETYFKIRSGVAGLMKTQIIKCISSECKFTQKRWNCVLLNLIHAESQYLDTNDYKELSFVVFNCPDIFCKLCCLQCCLRTRPPRTKPVLMKQWYSNVWEHHSVPNPLAALLRRGETKYLPYINAFQAFQNLENCEGLMVDIDQFLVKDFREYVKPAISYIIEGKIVAICNVGSDLLSALPNALLEIDIAGVETVTNANETFITLTASAETGFILYTNWSDAEWTQFWVKLTSSDGKLRECLAKKPSSARNAIKRRSSVSELVDVSKPNKVISDLESVYNRIEANAEEHGSGNLTIEETPPDRENPGAPMQGQSQEGCDLIVSPEKPGTTFVPRSAHRKVIQYKRRRTEDLQLETDLKKSPFQDTFFKSFLNLQQRKGASAEKAKFNEDPSSVFDFSQTSVSVGADAKQNNDPKKPPGGRSYNSRQRTKSAPGCIECKDDESSGAVRPNETSISALNSGKTGNSETRMEIAPLSKAVDPVELPHIAEFLMDSPHIDYAKSNKGKQETRGRRKRNEGYSATTSLVKPKDIIRPVKIKKQSKRKLQGAKSKALRNVKMAFVNEKGAAPKISPLKSSIGDILNEMTKPSKALPKSIISKRLDLLVGNSSIKPKGKLENSTIGKTPRYLKPVRIAPKENKVSTEYPKTTSFVREIEKKVQRSFIDVESNVSTASEKDRRYDYPESSPTRRLSISALPSMTALPSFDERDKRDILSVAGNENAMSGERSVPMDMPSLVADKSTIIYSTSPFDGYPAHSQDAINDDLELAGPSMEQLLPAICLSDESIGSKSAYKTGTFKSQLPQLRDSTTKGLFDVLEIPPPATTSTYRSMFNKPHEPLGSVEATSVPKKLLSSVRNKPWDLEEQNLGERKDRSAQSASRPLEQDMASNLYNFATIVTRRLQSISEFDEVVNNWRKQSAKLVGALKYCNGEHIRSLQHMTQRIHKEQRRSDDQLRDTLLNAFC